MTPTRRLLSAIALAALALAAFSAPSRVRTRLDANWRFAMEPNSTAVHPALPGWEWTALDAAPNVDEPRLSGAASDADWRPATPGEDVFHGRRGFAQFRLRLDRRLSPAQLERAVLHFEGVDDDATVYVNGAKVLHHEGWDEPFDLPLGQAGWRSDGPNEIDVLDENTDGPGGLAATWIAFRDAEPASPPEARPAFKDGAWRVVHLPHDFVVEGVFAKDDDPGHGSLPRGAAWYRKTFQLPASARNKSVWVDFEGAFSDAHVWLNGHYLGAHRSGYTGFRFDLQRWARFDGKNVLAVHVDARKTEGWWYEGGGIYRHVWLTVADPVHVSPLGGVYVRTAVTNVKGPKPSATLYAQVQVDNTTAAAVGCRLRATFFRPDGREVASRTLPLRIAGKQTRLAQLSVPEPRAVLWSLQAPRLYAVRVEVLRGNRVADSTTTDFGVRTIRFDPDKGFFLNERPVKLKGTCNHQDFAGVGIGIPDSLFVWRVKQLKWLGSNAYRCSHNEVAPELLDACDRLGMLVMDENREFGDTWTGKANQRTQVGDLADLRQEVLRDRNHPSIIMWSLCNEEFGVQSTPTGARIGEPMKAAVKALDDTRPVTAALNGGHGSYLSKVLDLEGFNYGPGEYPSYHAAHPGHPMFASETASATTTRGEYAEDRTHGYVSAFDPSLTAERAWEPVARAPYCAGAFVWTGFDYKGEPTPYGWPCVNSHFGILDEAGFPKDAAWYYRAWWGAAPSVHIAPSWNWPGQDGKPKLVRIYSNADAVELFLNGRSLGRKANPPYEHLDWTVPYRPGRLLARAYRAGRLVATDAVETTGAPARLVATIDAKSLVGDGEDSAVIRVAVVDSHGRTVPYAANMIAFSARGAARIVGVGNGDPSCHEPDRATRRSAFHGLAAGILQASNRAGTVRIVVSAPGLKPAVVTVRVIRGEDS